MVEVVGYRSEWPERFAALRDAYSAELDRDRVPHRIEHVGSTSVPGLAAKPVIDVDVVVGAAAVDAATRALGRLGFEPRGDLGVPERYAFLTPERFAPTNTYVVVDGSLALRNHLAVRDVLRVDDDLRRAYDEVKRHAAATASDIDEYIELKSGILARILERAGISDRDRESIARTNRGITRRGSIG